MRDRIRDKLAYIFEDRGEHIVKNVAQPVGVYAMDATVIASLPPVSAMVHAASTSRGLAARVAGLVRAAAGVLNRPQQHRAQLRPMA